MRLLKDFFKNGHRNVIHNSQKLEATQMSINKRMNKLPYDLFTQWDTICRSLQSITCRSNPACCLFL